MCERKTWWADGWIPKAAESSAWEAQGGYESSCGRAMNLSLLAIVKAANTGFLCRCPFFPVFTFSCCCRLVDGCTTSRPKKPIAT